MKGEPFIAQAKDAFLACLQEVPFVKINAVENRKAGEQVNACFEIETPGGKSIVFIEAMGELAPA